MPADPEWFLFFTPPSTSIKLDVHGLSEGESFSFAASRIGRPFFVSESGECHKALNRFFASGRMRHRSAGTNAKYAYSLRMWATFLERKGKSWFEADDEAVLDYMFWRRHDEDNPRPVSGSTWSVDAAAITLFYEWARKYLSGPQLTVTTSNSDPRRYQAGNGGDLRPSTVRSSSVRWLSPAAVELWRDVGIHGVSPEGVERIRWRPRSQWRDAAFVDALYSSGIRLQECASILVAEVSQPSGSDARYTTHQLADACAKGLRGHSYWLRSSAHDSIAGYMQTERADAVRRGQRSGAYESLSDAWVVESTEYRPDDAVELRRLAGEARRLMRIADMTPSFRQRLLIRRDAGLEPAMLWLNENGMPRPKHAWYKTFNAANARVAKAGVSRLRCHPHMLRHSFALKWYAVGRLIWERRAAASDERYLQDFREQFGDTWNLVQTMLGHADVETTKGVYLEPFRVLDVKALLEYGKEELDAETLLSVLSNDPRVRLGGSTDEVTW